jgi:alpha-beta hydrolase superfamily lysophospholipase
MPRFANLLQDIALASRAMTDRFGSLPQVILGHSMGGNLAISYVLRRKEIDADSVQPAGLVLVAPMLMPPRPMPRPWIFAAWLTGHVFPFLRFGPGVDADQLTSDPDELRAIKEDPKLHSQIPMHLATQLVAQGRWALDQARQIEWPTLILYGQDDALIDQAACENLAIRIGDSACLATFPDTKHAVFHDRTKAAVIKRLDVWLETNFAECAI